MWFVSLSQKPMSTGKTFGSREDAEAYYAAEVVKVRGCFTHPPVETPLANCRAGVVGIQFRSTRKGGKLGAITATLIMGPELRV